MTIAPPQSEAEWRASFPAPSSQSTIDVLLGAVEETDEYNYAQSEGEAFPEPFVWLTSTTSLCLNEHDGHAFEDLRPLGALTRLRKVSLAIADSTNLEGLGALGSLEALELQGGARSDWSCLSTLLELRELSLSGDAPQTLPPLHTLTKLTHLYWQARVKDLSALRGLTSLTKLELQYNDIRDLSPLASLGSLEVLNFTANQVVDTSPLQGLTRLERLDLKYNCIGDFSPLNGLKVARSLAGDPSQLDPTHPPMAAILQDWENLDLWVAYARWLLAHGLPRGTELKDKLEGRWHSLPTHWARAEEEEMEKRGGRVLHRTVRPLLRVD